MYALLHLQQGCSAEHKALYKREGEGMHASSTAACCTTVPTEGGKFQKYKGKGKVSLRQFNRSVKETAVCFCGRTYAGSQHLIDLFSQLTVTIWFWLLYPAKAWSCEECHTLQVGSGLLADSRSAAVCRTKRRGFCLCPRQTPKCKCESLDQHLQPATVSYIGSQPCQRQTRLALLSIAPC